LPRFEEIPPTDAPRLDEIPPIVLPKSPNHLSTEGMGTAEVGRGSETRSGRGKGIWAGAARGFRV
jgi:hypothetical protein